MPVQDKNSRERRVQFDVLPEMLQELDQMMADCDIRTRRDLFDHAITIFQWTIQARRDGKEVAAYDRERDRVEIVRFPVLETAYRKGEQQRKLAAEEPRRPPAPDVVWRPEKPSSAETRDSMTSMPAAKRHPVFA